MTTQMKMLIVMMKLETKILFLILPMKQVLLEILTVNMQFNSNCVVLCMNFIFNSLKVKLNG